MVRGQLSFQMYIRVEIHSAMSQNSALCSGFSRRDLLPIWSKLLLWIIIIISASSILFEGIILMALGDRLAHLFVSTSLTDLITTVGIVVLGAAAYQIWTEKTWAIDLFLLVVICQISLLAIDMFNQSSASGLHIRLELCFLIPLSIQLLTLRKKWLQMSTSTD